ncbi:MAG: hypothetical protein KIPDCIKN_04371 [Haliscomenobacter sp.]|nr:hypothetical protein [Haliscomenobacter sp.]
MLHARLFRAEYQPSGGANTAIPDVFSADWSFERRITYHENTGAPEPRAIRAMGRLYLYDFDIAETLVDLTPDGESTRPNLHLYYRQRDGQPRVKSFSNVIFGAPGRAVMSTTREQRNEDSDSLCVIPFVVAMEENDLLSDFVDTANTNTNS